MDEFSKINWRIQHPSELEYLTQPFLPQEICTDSLIYQNFLRPIRPAEELMKFGISMRKFVPGKDQFRRIIQHSLLNAWQKRECLVAMKLLQSGKDSSIMTAKEKHALKTYTELQPKIIEENQKWMEFVKRLWNKYKSKRAKPKPGVTKYGKDCCQARMAMFRDYPKFYSTRSVMSLTFNELEQCIEYNFVKNALEVGTVARYSQPNLYERCQLKFSSLPEFQLADVNSKLPVSKDANVLQILENCPVDVVMSMSSIKQIMDNTDDKVTWLMPVVVKELNVKGVNQKVAYIDKPLQKKNPNSFDLEKYTFKRMVKANFCQYEAFSFSGNDIKIEEQEPSELKSKKTGKLGKISGKILHNASYRLWDIKTKDIQSTLMKNKTKDTSFNLLVRSKLDGCEMVEPEHTLQPVVLSTKVERQLEFGANIPTKSELAREWTSLFFTPFSNLYRVRLFNPDNEVFAIEKCPMQKINSEALAHHNYRPNLGLGILQKLIQEITALETGNYILQHLPEAGAFVSVLQECSESVQNALDLHKESSDFKPNCKQIESWVPIDPNYILPAHEVFEQMPGVFCGNGKPGVEAMKSNGKKKKKKKAQKTKYCK